jgi:hypothetical protein
VLRGSDGGWRVVDPALLTGDAERTAVDVLWHRVDEMSDTGIPRWFATLVSAADLDPELARVGGLARHRLLAVGAGARADRGPGALPPRRGCTRGVSEGEPPFRGPRQRGAVDDGNR